MGLPMELHARCTRPHAGSQHWSKGRARRSLTAASTAPRLRATPSRHVDRNAPAPFAPQRAHTQIRARILRCSRPPASPLLPAPTTHPPPVLPPAHHRRAALAVDVTPTHPWQQPSAPPLLPLPACCRCICGRPHPPLSSFCSCRLPRALNHVGHRRRRCDQRRGGGGARGPRGGGSTGAGCEEGQGVCLVGSSRRFMKACLCASCWA